MFVKQISVFIENRQGMLAEFTQKLGEAGLDLIALSIADTTNFGILRAIVADTERAFTVIREAGYAASLTDVLAVAVPDRPGGLSEVLTALHGAQISVEYLYSFVRNVQENAVIIFRVDEPERAMEVLRVKGVRLLSQEEVATA
jgi:hypothetical protein